MRHMSMIQPYNYMICLCTAGSSGAEELPRVLGGLGIAIISTNKGVMTDKEARLANVGGEVLAFIW